MTNTLIITLCVFSAIHIIYTMWTRREDQRRLAAHQRIVAEFKAIIVRARFEFEILSTTINNAKDMDKHLKPICKEIKSNISLIVQDLEQMEVLYRATSQAKKIAVEKADLILKEKG